jgi:hypothetical protein
LSSPKVRAKNSVVNPMKIRSFIPSVYEIRGQIGDKKIARGVKNSSRKRSRVQPQSVVDNSAGSRTAAQWQEF